MASSLPARQVATAQNTSMLVRTQCRGRANRSSDLRPDWPPRNALNVLASDQIASAKGRICLLPAGGKPGDVGRRQTGRVLAQQPFQCGAKIAGGETAPSLFITATVIDPRCFKLHRPRSQGKLAPLGPTVAHHQRASVLVALATMALDLIVGLRR
jgi:hypothetical protein